MLWERENVLGSEWQTTGPKSVPSRVSTGDWYTVAVLLSSHHTPLPIPLCVTASGANIGNVL